MCGRYSLSASPETIRDHFGLHALPALEPRYNIAPTQVVPVIRAGEEGRELALLHWGLIPAWAKDEKTGYRMINARAETVAEKPAFRNAVRHRRCLVPADGFYEWRTTARGKQPYHVRRRDGALFAFAGLWEHWQDEHGRTIESFTILVTDANALLRPIHDRMPAIIEPADYERWLSRALRDPQALAPLLQPYPAVRLQAVPVSTRVNTPRHDDPDCIAPLAEE
jgi:putative SOS response-associated peptidase YedK